MDACFLSQKGVFCAQKATDHSICISMHARSSNVIIYQMIPNLNYFTTEENILSPPWFKHSLLQLNCVFLIYCTTVKLDIQFLNKGIHLLSTLIFKDDSLKMFKKRSVSRLSSSCRNKKNWYLGFGLRPSDYRTFGLLDLQTIGPQNYRTVTV